MSYTAITPASIWWGYQFLPVSFLPQCAVAPGFVTADLVQATSCVIVAMALVDLLAHVHEGRARVVIAAIGG